VHKKFCTGSSTTPPQTTMITLHVLGSGTCAPTVERGASGLVVEIGERFILLDPGPGSLRQMPRSGIDFRRIDFIFLSHFHPDHVSDLVPFFFATNYAADLTRRLPLEVIGPPGLEDFYKRLHDVFGRWIEAQSYPCRFHEALEHVFEFSDFTAETLPLRHSEASIGFRISAGGKTLAYSGDTDSCPEAGRLGGNADLLILECSFPEERKTKGHLTPAEAGKIAREASCKKLLLTHFYPVYQGHDIVRECRREFPGEVILAEDGMRLHI
jgi:ribonuclease BN (tRNA processing enzyme)